jgi:hypothetical protein
MNRNAEPSTKRASKDHNINAEVKDIVRYNTDINKILPFTLTSPPLFMGHRERFPSELMSSAMKEYPVLSEDKSEIELTLV